MNLSSASVAIAAFFLSSLTLTEATIGRVRGGGESDTDALKLELELEGAEHTAAQSGFDDRRQLKKDGNVCGPETGTSCFSSLNARSMNKLVTCLNEMSSNYMDTKVSIVEFPFPHDKAENLEVFKLTFPQVDFTNFEKANFNDGKGTTRFPAGIFYAESQDEVIEAVKCANQAGYKVSPRGRGHSRQGLSSMDGYLVIDMSLMCDPDEFVDTTFDEDEVPWILGGGQRAIGSIKSGAGCTNAVMLAHAGKAFPDGIYVVGDCPSVGIAGFSTGGGMGLATSWVGLGIDAVLSYDIVLYDGSNVTASRKENSDLYWALQGGGSGYGVITSLETAVISPPEPSSGASTVTFISKNYKTTQTEAREFSKRFQDFIVPDLPFDSAEYNEKIRSTSARFGCVASLNPYNVGMTGLFLGSKDEAISTLTEAGLLDTEILDPGTMPSIMLEFSSFVEGQLYWLCFNLETNFGPQWTYSSKNFCADLGIDSKYCYETNTLPSDPGTTYYVPKCAYTNDSFNLDDVKNVILPAIANAAIKPQCWFNRPGGIRLGMTTSDPGPNLLFGRVDPDILLEMFNAGGVRFGHLGHGAPTLIARDETGYSNREEIFLSDGYSAVATILVNKVYGGDSSKLRGYLGYLNPEGNRDWRSLYFKENYERLSVIKAKYDETNGFGNPLQVEPAPSSGGKSGKSAPAQAQTIFSRK